MYLLDTNVISEIRKGKKADKGVQGFFARVISEKTPVYAALTYRLSGIGAYSIPRWPG